MSVASFFVSRVDTEADKRLDAVGHPELKGKLAVANAKLAYKYFLEAFSGPRWAYLEGKGAHKQRCLWASTSTKNPDYRDVIYVEELIGPDTVNTMPLETIRAFQDHGEVRGDTVLKGVNKAEKLLGEARRRGRGLRRRHAHARGGRRAEVRRLVRGDRREHPCEAGIPGGRMTPAGLVERIWAHDASVWTDSEEAEWLGWLDEPWRMHEDVDLLLQYADSVVERIDSIVLLGMGGSSLAPEVLRRTFRQETFHVLDTTHPQAIRDLESKIDVARTLFVAASKSGSTLETRSHTDYFWEKSRRGELWAAVTDPGSSLEELALERGFGAIFAGVPSIGGRYSALSAFGMVPAALMGIDIARLLLRAQEMADACRLAEGNPGLDLGLSLGEGWLAGRDKVCIEPQARRLRTVGGAAARRVDRQARQGPDPGPGRVRRRPRPAGAGGAARRRVRARAGVLPLGVRDRRRRVDPRHQSVRPARRAGGEGHDHADPRLGRGSARRACWFAGGAVRPGAAR